MGTLADIPGYGAYAARRQQIEQEPLAQLQQAQGVMSLRAAMDKQRDDQMLKTALAESGGDAEKAAAIAIKTGNFAAAHQLAPLAKLQQEQRQNAETPQLLADLNRQFAAPMAAPASPVAADIPTASPADAMVTPQGPASSPQEDRQRRVAHLTAMSMIPKYANNPVVAQRLNAEIDKLTSVKPMVEHNFAVGDNMVQPHISHDNGQTWAPIPGSKPSAKFAKQVEGIAGPDNAAQPTADTLDMDAWRYLTDGTLPPNMGRGMQGTKQATDIRNRASSLAKDMGMSADEIRMSQLTNKTQVQAMGQLAKARAQILQFEKTANMNSDLALEASDKVDRTGVPVLNRWLQAGRTQIAGDPEASKFHAATETFVSEYAKVMSGGYGASATTEGAQNRAHTLLNTAQTKEQFRDVVGQLKKEMNNRVSALNGQMDEERARLRGGIVRTPTAAPGTPAAAAPVAGPSVESLLEKYKN